MKNFTYAVVTAGLLSGACVVQAEEGGISGNVTLTSDYVWRGISQTQNNGAIQGGVDYAHDSGFYVGAWGSNVDFDNDASLELDLYAGYSTDLTENVSVDVGVLKYTYPDASGLNFTEGYISVSTAGFTLGHNSSGSLWADESMSYTYLSYETEIGGIGISASYGQYDTKDMNFDSEQEYEDWNISVSKGFMGVDLALTYTDTSLDDNECAAFAGDEDYCDAIVAVSISKSL
jgi:uncharacterized protein (TIGR02001 family)